MSKPTFGSIFSGIGGFDEGFHRAGLKCLWQCEIDKPCLRVLRRHYPGVRRWDDVRTFRAGEMPAVDVICFGSPCQDLSVAGQRRGMAGERSGLFFEAIRIVRELSPALVVWENVPGAFSSNAGRDFGAVLDAMVQCGTRDVCWRVIDARYRGLAQRRKRVFLVADFRGERAGEILFESPCVCRDFTPRGKARANVAASLRSRSASASVNAPGRGGEDDYNLVVNSLDAHMGMGGPDGNAAQANHLVSHTLSKNGRYDGESETFVAGFKRGQGKDARSIGYEVETSPTLTSSDSGTQNPPGVMVLEQNQRNEEGRSTHTMQKGGFGVRRLTPT